MNNNSSAAHFHKSPEPCLDLAFQMVKFIIIEFHFCTEERTVDFHMID